MFITVVIMVMLRRKKVYSFSANFPKFFKSQKMKKALAICNVKIVTL